MYSERTQVLLSKEQVARLKRRAKQEGRSVGAVIRQAVDAWTGAPDVRRQEAIDRLLRTDAPVADWDVMKEEILRGASGTR
jgi:hypothetical protein